MTRDEWKEAEKRNPQRTRKCVTQLPFGAPLLNLRVAPAPLASTSIVLEPFSCSSQCFINRSNSRRRRRRREGTARVWSSHQHATHERYHQPGSSWSGHWGAATRGTRVEEYYPRIRRGRCAAIKVYAISLWRSTFLRRPFLCTAITIPRSITRGSEAMVGPLDVYSRARCSWSGCCGICGEDSTPLTRHHRIRGRSAHPVSSTTTIRIMQLTYESFHADRPTDRWTDRHTN